MPISTPIATAAKSILSKVTRLDSGITVASIPATSHFAAVGVYIDVGPVYESSGDRGASRFISSLAFKSTQAESESQVLQTMAQLGGNLFCTPTRESLIYQGSVLTHEVPRAIKLLADVTLRPALTDAEIDQARQVLAFEAQEITSRPDSYIGELLHTIAYGNQGLGNPIMICDPHLATTIDANTIRHFAKQYICPNRMVVAGAGVNHGWLCDLVGQHFTAPEQTPDDKLAIKEPKGSYVGGTHQLVIPKPPPTHTNFEQPMTHIQVAFPVPTFTHPDMYPLSTLQVLMGGGGSFSAGGPGKGMYSRLYTNVLNRYHWINSCLAFQHAYARSYSLWGLSASCIPSSNEHVVNVLCGEFVQMTKDLDSESVVRAKNQLKSSLMMNLESMVITVEDLGRQVLAQNHRIEPLQLVDKIDAVTKDELVRVALEMMSKPPTAVVIGEDLSRVTDFVSAFPAFKKGSFTQTLGRRLWSR